MRQQSALARHFERWQRLYKARLADHPALKADSWNDTSCPACPFHTDSHLAVPISENKARHGHSKLHCQNTLQCAWVLHHHRSQRSFQSFDYNLQKRPAQRKNQNNSLKRQKKCLWRIWLPTRTFVQWHNPILFQRHYRLLPKML